MTKEDFAVFAQMISDRYKSEQQIQLREIQRLSALVRPTNPPSEEEGDEEDEDDGEGDEADVEDDTRVRGPKAKKPRNETNSELNVSPGLAIICP